MNKKSINNILWTRPRVQEAILLAAEKGDIKEAKKYIRLLSILEKKYNVRLQRQRYNKIINFIVSLMYNKL